MAIVVPIEKQTPAFTSFTFLQSVIQLRHYNQSQLEISINLEYIPQWQRVLKLHEAPNDKRVPENESPVSMSWNKKLTKLIFES